MIIIFWCYNNFGINLYSILHFIKCLLSSAITDIIKLNLENWKVKILRLLYIIHFQLKNFYVLVFLSLIHKVFYTITCLFDLPQFLLFSIRSGLLKIYVMPIPVTVFFDFILIHLSFFILINFLSQETLSDLPSSLYFIHYHHPKCEACTRFFIYIAYFSQ